MKKIAWFTEGNWIGKVPRTFEGMRNDSAWMCVFEATHYPILKIHEVTEKYDLGIVTLPKKGIDILSKYPLIENLRKCCNQIATMQEGPADYAEDYPLEHQIWYCNTLMEMDFLFVHNQRDVNYFEGLLNKPCRIMPTLMIEDLIKSLPNVPRHDAIIGGNMCSWYGGWPSYIIAQEFNCKIYAPSMGRKVPGEEQLDNLIHLPYMSWLEWIKHFNHFKYAIHMMKTHAAGTFALNASLLGVPCIGFKKLDTQEKLHPLTTVELGDLKSAREIARKLRDNHDFYKQCSELTKKLYHQYYSEEVFREKMKDLFE